MKRTIWIFVFVTFAQVHWCRNSLFSNQNSQQIFHNASLNQDQTIDGERAEIRGRNYSAGSQSFTFFPFLSPPHPPPLPPPSPPHDKNDYFLNFFLPPCIIIMTFIASIILLFCGVCVKKFAWQRRYGYLQQYWQQLQQESQNYGGFGDSSNDSYINTSIAAGMPRGYQIYQRENYKLQEQLLERRIQDSLISETFVGASSEITCCICLDELKDGDNETILPCKHHFHKNCFDEWLQKQRTRVTCPLCKLHLKDTILP